MKKIVAPILLMLSLPAVADYSYKPQIDTSCENGNYEFKVDTSNHPLAYKNADLAGCDLGLEMPGLPSIDGSLNTNLDSCEILKKVTGDSIAKFNDKIDDMLDDKLKEITNGVLNEDWDVNDLLIENLNSN